MARQAPLSVGFPRQEYWSGLTFPSPRDLPHPGIELTFPVSPVLEAHSLPLSHQRNPLTLHIPQQSSQSPEPTAVSALFLVFLGSFSFFLEYFWNNLTAFCPRATCVCVYIQLLSHVKLFANPWTVTHQALLPMGFPRQEYWSGLTFPSPGDLPDPEIEPLSPA